MKDEKLPRQRWDPQIYSTDENVHDLVDKSLSPAPFDPRTARLECLKVAQEMDKAPDLWADETSKYNVTEWAALLYDWVWGGHDSVLGKSRLQRHTALTGDIGPNCVRTEGVRVEHKPKDWWKNRQADGEITVDTSPGPAILKASGPMAESED